MEKQKSDNHWYDYLASVFVPSLGTTDVLLWADALTNFTQQALQDSQKAISALQFSSVQSLSCVQFFATPWVAAHQASLSITISHGSLKLTSMESVMPSSHLILCRPLFLLPPIPPSIRVSNESSFPMSQLFTWGGQSTGVSALASFLPKNTQGWSPLEWTGC